MPADVSTAQVMQKLALSLKSIKDELGQWHEESKKNQISIAALSKRLDLLSHKTTVPPELQKEITDMATKVQTLSAKKPGMSAEVKAELARLQSQMETISKLPLAQAAPEARAALEEQLTKIQSEKEKILSLQTKLEELSSTSTTADQQHDAELAALKEKVTAAPRSMSAEGMEGEEFMKTLKTELEAWHKESMENATALNGLLKRVSAVEAQTQAGEKVKKEMERTMNQVGQVAGSIDKFEELKQTLLKHNEEFEDLYSTIGKERVELSSLNSSVVKLQQKLVEWGERNTENLEEVTDIRQDLASLTKELKTKNIGEKLETFSDNMGVMADRVESLQRQERELEEAQQDLIEFDKGLKELVRKAVVATLSREEFEQELEKLEGKKPRRKKAAEPQTKDVKSKMRELRAALKEEKVDKGLSSYFTAFEKDLNNASSDEEKKLLWEKLGKAVSDVMGEILDSAKAKLTSGKAAGEDVSKLNLLVAKVDIGIVSLETAVSLQNLAKTKEIIQKLGDLKAQTEKEV
ncbi:hypothetical protein ACFLQ2_01840 [archaeon]